MKSFNAVLATAFDLDPARIATAPTDLLVDDFENLTGSTFSTVCAIPYGRAEAATACLCATDEVETWTMAEV